MEGGCEAGGQTTQSNILLQGYAPPLCCRLAEEEGGNGGGEWLAAAPPHQHEPGELDIDLAKIDPKSQNFPY
jgi:hypothetical protein